MAESSVLDAKSVLHAVTSKHLAAAALVSATLALAPPSRAEPVLSREASRAAPDPRPARELFAEAVGLAQQGHYAAAKAAFLRAYAREPHPRVLYNIGQCEVRLGQFGSAIEILEQFLANGGISDDERRAVELQVEEIRTLVRGVSAAKRPERSSAPEQRETLARRHASPERLAVPSVNPPSHVWNWVLGGAGMAVLGSAAAVYVWNDNRHDDWEAERAELDRVSRSGADLSRDAELWDRARRSNDHLASIQRFDVVAVVAATLGVATVGLGIWTWAEAGERSGIALKVGSGTELAWTATW